MIPRPIFFATSAALRAWFKKHHKTADELWVGYYKSRAGKPTVTWRESVDQALCFGWIDSIRKRVDATSYTNRFTPRKPGSTWSAINAQRVAELTARGLMTSSGLKAFRERAPDRTGIYSYEQRHMARLSAAQVRQFRAHKKAWQYFQTQPPSYQKTAIWWVVTAKKEETQMRRLATLIESSARGLPIPPLARPASKG